MAHRAGFEPTTPRFVVWCSIQLSYRCFGAAQPMHRTRQRQATRHAAISDLLRPAGESRSPQTISMFIRQRIGHPLSIFVPLLATGKARRAAKCPFEGLSAAKSMRWPANLPRKRRCAPLSPCDCVVKTAAEHGADYGASGWIFAGGTPRAMRRTAYDSKDGRTGSDFDFFIAHSQRVGANGGAWSGRMFRRRQHAVR